MLIPSNVGARNGDVRHNLLGQRLGRKGMETRERILAAALRELEGPQEEQGVTLTSVAREASVGITNLYRYFPDLGALLLAVLHRVMASADAAFLDRLRTRWPDREIEDHCLGFLRAHHEFWQRHARILHLRNSFADDGDQRFLDYRNETSRPLIDLLIAQMDCATGDLCGNGAFEATVLLTGFERVATVVTNPLFKITMHDTSVVDEAAYVDRLLRAEASIMTLTITATRQIRVGRGAKARSGHSSTRHS